MAETKPSSNGNAVLVAIFATALLVVFTAFRSNDLLKLPQLVGNLGGGPLFGDTGFDVLFGLLVSAGICMSWAGFGSLILKVLSVADDDSWHVASRAGLGAVVSSVVWFFLGLVGGYSGIVSVAMLVIGLITFVVFRAWQTNILETDRFSFSLKLAIAVVLLLTIIAAIAPPIAKDTLLYHFAVPRAFIAQGGNGFIEGNIASYLALGTEMHSVWAMLLGDYLSPRTAEVAAGTTAFLFFPLLLTTIARWANELGISRHWSLIVTLMVAAIPTAFHVASSGYVDLSLALYVMLATRSLTRWWKTQERSSLILMAIFLGGALSVKLTALFVIAAFALVILLRARVVENPVAIAPGSDKGSAGKVVLGGFAALVLAGAIASPWYLRTWAATGSPVFPFYMSIWKGAAPGWDVERSNLFQGMNSQYGGAAANPSNYLMAPARVSLAAQPENPELYDGVLGAAFLIGLPLLIWGIWKRKVGVDVMIAAGVAGIVYLFWLFSSPQLRYLLPIVPLLAIGIAAAAESISNQSVKKAWKFSLIAASVLAMLTSFAWFCQKAPLRVVLGGESRDDYLTRNLDYYPYYQVINNETAQDAKVWLINMRRDTYNIERPIFADYIFEDWTLRKMVWDARSIEELRAKTAAMGITYILARHDFLFDYDKTTLVDDKKPRAENEAKLKMVRELILDPARTVRSDNRFSLVKVF